MTQSEFLKRLSGDYVRPKHDIDDLEQQLADYLAQSSRTGDPVDKTIDEYLDEHFNSNRAAGR